VQITSPTTGTAGEAVLAITIHPNTNNSSRSAQVTVTAGQSTSLTIPVNQFGTATPPVSTTGLRFVPLEPCRLLETRTEYNFQGRSGPFGPPSLTTAETRILNPRQSTVCQSIPATAKAYALNVTLVPHQNSPAEFITIYPTGDPRPEFWTIRSPDGLTVANSAIVRAGTNGAINVYSSDATDLLIDIFGYFTDDPSAPALSYFPLTPCRVVDTRQIYRPQTGPFGPPTMARGERRTFRFPQASQYCQIPAGARAYSMTITVAPPNPLQFLTAWPTGESQPNVSSINSPSGRTLANSIIAPAGASTGGIDIFVLDTSDIIIDITGYFGPDDGQAGLSYFPVTQCRMHVSQFADEQTKSIPVPSTGCAAIPPTAKAYLLNVTAIPGGSPMPFLTAWPKGGVRPNASMLNAFEGQTVTNTSIIPAGIDGGIDIYTYRKAMIVAEISGYFARQQ
jgi:hypothetical protein